ncbi:MAG: hypothetical protein IJV37_05465 [Bacteroidales bacterium]|nr:hypothetical protein [Bacteroidales bacterium]
MVDILTDTGVFLDLDPDAEFELTIENPLLQEDRIPVPFSTAISFLPTSANKAVFGYLDTMMLEPRVKQLGAAILVGGVQLYAGSLIYDSIDEDGRISYTFSGKDLQTEWGAKIWEISGLELEGNDYTAILNALKADTVPGIHLPPVVDAALTGEPGFRPTPTDYRPGRSQMNYNRKYRNQPDATDFQDLVPAVEIGRLLGAAVSLSDVPDASEFLQRAVVFGTWWTSGKPMTKNGRAYYNVAETLPDITLADLLLDVCLIFCAAVFQDGNRLRLISASEVLAGSAPLDWDQRVSDRFRSSREERSGYELGFGGDESENAAQGAVDEKKDTLSGVLGSAKEEYLAIEHSGLADLYSLKAADQVSIQYDGTRTVETIGITHEILIDRIDRVSAKQEAEGTDEMHSVSVGLRLAKCAPVRRYWKVFTTTFTLVSDIRMAAILSLPAYGGERPKEAYIALCSGNQASDKGVIIADPDSAGSADQDLGVSLSPDALFAQYHQAYAAWLAKDRQLLSVDLDLTPFELASFRMWQAVRVRSRNFLVSKLSVRVNASSEGVDVSADLISL